MTLRVQWLSTRASGRAHTHSADDGVTGWKLHAIVTDEENSFEKVGKQKALCGLRPRHGWSMDLFIEEECKRCVRNLCPVCNGDGKLMSATGDSKHPLQAVTCESCKGTGAKQ